MHPHETNFENIRLMEVGCYSEPTERIQTANFSLTFVSLHKTALCYRTEKSATFLMQVGSLILHLTILNIKKRFISFAQVYSKTLYQEFDTNFNC